MSTSVPRISRRTLHQAMGGVLISAATYRRAYGANERIGIGFIGYGLIGKRHVLDFKEQKDVDCVAVCDAHRGRVAEARALIGGACRGYADFRELLDAKDVQAVVISTPDHWHALMTMLACAAGKDVYVEKPLSLFVREGQWMIEVARRNQSVVQVGTQQRSGKHYQRARKLISEGAIGRIVSVRMSAYRNIVPGFGSPADSPPPAELDWNSFLGPAPSRPYNANRGIYHFRWFWDYSGGQMTNLGQHALDIMQWCLPAKLRSVTSSGGRFALQDTGETPDTQDALFELERIGPQRERFTAIWSHREASAGPSSGYGTEFFGTKGSLGINRKGFTIVPDAKVPPANRVPQFAGAHPVGGPTRVATPAAKEIWTEAIDDQTGSESEQFLGHVRNFLDCVKSRQSPIAELTGAHQVGTMCHLANLSLRTGRQLRWDAEKEEIIDDAAANQMLVRSYRAPWDAELRALGVRP
jgi:predicted dehydrogenase